MACYHPLTGYRSAEVTKNGKRKLVFNSKYAIDDGEVIVSCGQCVGCRLERSRQWAMRCIHEAQMHENNCFLTLTYNDDNLPYPPSLEVKHYQDFMKRFRKKFKDHKIRFFHCGEYGDETRRPHYHAIIFGFDFPDKKLWKESFNGDHYYTSETLNKLWGKGYAIIGSVTFESAAYVARYIMKKVNGENKDEHYRCVDQDSGESFDIKPEYITMSRRPGIGKTWFEKYKSDVYPSDFVVVRGKKMRPPKYYDNLLAEEDYDELDYIKFQREVNANVSKLEQSYDRLITKEKVKLKQIEKLQRGL